MFVCGQWNIAKYPPNINNNNAQVGVALAQDQSVDSIKDIISEIDLVHISCGDPCDDEVPYNPDMISKVHIFIFIFITIHQQQTFF